MEQLLFQIYLRTIWFVQGQVTFLLNFGQSGTYPGYVYVVFIANKTRVNCSAPAPKVWDRSWRKIKEMYYLNKMIEGKWNRRDLSSYWSCNLKKFEPFLDWCMSRGAMLIFSVLFQFYRLSPKRHLQENNNNLQSSRKSVFAYIDGFWFFLKIENVGAKTSINYSKLLPFSTW